ncbi:MAG: YfbM family protein [Nibricoccus sp.]
MRLTLIFVSLWLAAVSAAKAGVTMSAYAITTEHAARIQNDEALLDALIQEGKGAKRSVDFDKSWDGMHYLLTGVAKPDGSIGSKAIFGGSPVGSDLGYPKARVLAPKEVQEIAAMLEKLSFATLAKHYDPKEMQRLKIYPEIWETNPVQLKDYLSSYYRQLVAFYKEAARAEACVVIRII